jgi:hypothetical protein
MGSESMCRGREIRLLHAAMLGNHIAAPKSSILDRSPLWVWAPNPSPGGDHPPLARPGRDRLNPGPRPTVRPAAAEVPGGSPPPALLESVDCWPLASLRRQIPGGSRPALYTVFASVSAGSGPSTRGPYAATSPRPPGRPGWPCVRTGARRT